MHLGFVPQQFLNLVISLHETQHNGYSNEEHTTATFLSWLPAIIQYGYINISTF